MVTSERPGGKHRSYVTEIWCPPADSGVHALHSRMPEPEPLPNPNRRQRYDRTWNRGPAG